MEEYKDNFNEGHNEKIYFSTTDYFLFNQNSLIVHRKTGKYLFEEIDYQEIKNLKIIAPNINIFKTFIRSALVLLFLSSATTETSHSPISATVGQVVIQFKNQIRVYEIDKNFNRIKNEFLKWEGKLKTNIIV